ncbi:MAG: DUF2142 domain-containing protein [Dorea sp.]|nr:DUF2142 domain-containing protein [Dorea sp.]
MGKRFKEIWGNKKIVHKFLFCVVCSVCAAFLVSLGTAAFYYARGGENKGKIKIEDTRIRENRNIEKEKETYIVSGNGGKIEISFPEKLYINKLQYLYRASQASEKGCEIKVYTENIYGDDIVEDIEDNFFPYMARSVINVKNKVSKIVFEFPKEDLYLELFDFTIDNSFKLNPFLAIMIGAFTFIVLYLLLFYRESAKRPEISTFVCTFVFGVTVLLLQLPFCSGWDEQIHFVNCYDMALTSKAEGTPSAIYYLADSAPWLNEHNKISVEERIDLVRIMNEQGQKIIPDVRSYTLQLSSTGYVFQAILITIGKFLRLPFFCIWLLGKFANILLYSIGMSFAVSIVPIGKRLLSVIAVLPIMIFSSTVYTYDITVNVFIIIGCCIWIREIINKEEIFSNKWRIVYVVSFIIGCLPKAVYAPLLLCALFMPSSKFRSLKDKRIFKSIIILGFLALMFSFVLPTILNPPVVADIRGGDTSVSRQLRYVLGKPFSYGIVLQDNIYRTFMDYTTGYMMSRMAYIGYGTIPPLYGMLIISVALTDSYCETKDQEQSALKVKEKIISLALIFMTIVLIWTALYLSYTEVGQTGIAGVQGRYYIPFIFWLYMCFRTKRINSTFSKEKYQLIVMLISCGMLMSQIVSMIYVGSCI